MSLKHKILFSILFILVYLSVLVDGAELTLLNDTLTSNSDGRWYGTPISLGNVVFNSTGAKMSSDGAGPPFFYGMLRNISFDYWYNNEVRFADFHHGSGSFTAGIKIGNSTITATHDNTNFNLENASGSQNSTALVVNNQWVYHKIQVNVTSNIVKWWYLIGASNYDQINTSQTPNRTISNYDWNRANKNIVELGIDRRFESSTFKELLVTGDSPIILKTPLDGIYTANNNINFSGQVIPSSGSNFTNITNATLFIWNSLGTVANRTTLINLTNLPTTFNYSIYNLNQGAYEWNIYGCFLNNSCFFDTQNLTFTSGIEITGQSYANTTIEGSLEPFRINVTLGEQIIQAVANIVYNNTSYSASPTISGNNVSFLRNIVVPGVDLTTDISFYWEILLTGPTGTVGVNSSTGSQRVTPLGIDNCGTFGTRILNFSVIDEELQTVLPNASIEAAVNIYDADRSSRILNISGIYNRTASFCINSNLTNASNLLLDTIVKYSEEVHATEYYNIYNQTLNSSSLSNNITLYDLNISDSTDFQLTFTGSDFLPVENALVFLERRYIAENIFKTVELPLTDSNGQSILHMVRNDVLYNIRIVRGTEVIGNFESITAFCEDFVIGNCKINLNAKDSTEQTFDYDESLGITYSGPSYNNNTKVMSFSFISVTGTSKSMSMEVTRNDILGNRTICNSEITGVSGTLACEVGDIDDTELRTNIYVNGVLTITKNVKLDPENLGAIGLFGFFILMALLIFMFSESKSGVLISIIIGLAAGFGLGFTNGALYGLGASGIWIILVCIIGLWKLNQGKTE